MSRRCNGVEFYLYIYRTCLVRFALGRLLRFSYLYYLSYCFSFLLRICRNDRCAWNSVDFGGKWWNLVESGGIW